MFIQCESALDGLLFKYRRLCDHQCSHCLFSFGRIGQNTLVIWRSLDAMMLCAGRAKIVGNSIIRAGLAAMRALWSCKQRSLSPEVSV
jgi:hypothetical protein